MAYSRDDTQWIITLGTFIKILIYLKFLIYLRILLLKIIFVQFPSRRLLVTHFLSKSNIDFQCKVYNWIPIKSLLTISLLSKNVYGRNFR